MGGGSSIFVVSPTSVEWNFEELTITFDKTWQEVSDALVAKIPCYLSINLGEDCSLFDIGDQPGMFPIVRAYTTGNGYFVNTVGCVVESIKSVIISADSANDDLKYYTYCMA